MLLLRGIDVWQIDSLNEKKIHLWTVLDSYPKAELPPMSHRMYLLHYAKVRNSFGPILFHIRKSLEAEIISIEERTFQENFPRKKAQRYPETSTYRTWIKKSRYMVDAAQGTIPVRPTTVWLYKKYNICERGCQDRGRQKEIPDTYGKHAAPLARSSSVFRDFKKAESGPVQGATVNRRLVEPTNSASVDTIHSNLGIVKKILWLLYAERKRES